MWNINNAGSTIVFGPTAETDRWHHLVGVGDSDSARLYIDGSLVATSTGGVSNINVPGANFRIGYENTRPSYFNGTIDEVRIYNRALTADEIREHYHGHTHTNFSPSPPPPPAP